MIFKKKAWLFIVIGVILLIAGCTSEKENKQSLQSDNTTAANHVPGRFALIPAEQQQITQINGIGYPGNDSALYVATNHGIKFFKGSKWLETSTNRHNYFSFQAVKDGFLASGHPEKGTGLKDPLGLVASSDQGKSLKRLAFYGTSNFHFLSASFSNRGIYVIQEQPSKQLDAGVYFSKDHGKHWEKSKFNNFNADSLGMIAVHPEDGDIIAMSTRTGIYYSTDNGNTMKRITDPVMVTALAFSGSDLVYSSVENQKILLKTMNPKSGKQSDVVFPFLDYDNPITYLAVDPKNNNNIAFTTYKNDLYDSNDGGKSWNNLLLNGKIGQE